VDLHRAIVESCDVYFYEAGKRLGINKLYQYATAFGLGKETGLGLAKETKGFMPTAQWKKENKKIPWYLGDTFMTAIGQGFVTTTPIQMATVMATFANGGKVYRPILVHQEQEPVDILIIKPETSRLVREGLAGVVNEPSGTAKGARSSLTIVGGKTGTAQVVGKKKGLTGERFMDHAWFVAFAPVQDPEIALAVFVEHGGGGGAVAAPIAKKAIDAYMTNKQKKNLATAPSTGEQQ
jgi:penicillin-binding protein 2